MSTDNTVTIHVAAEAVTRRVSNNSPALAARLALADFEAEFGRLPPGSYVEVFWQSADRQAGRRSTFKDLDAVRRARPSDKPGFGPDLLEVDHYAPPAAPAASPFEAWWPGTENASRSPVRTMAKEAWAAALAWAAGQAEAAGCACKSLWIASGRTTRTLDYDGDYRYEGDDFTVVRHDSRCPRALAVAIRAGRPPQAAAAELGLAGGGAGRLSGAAEVFVEWQVEKIDNQTFADRMQRILGTPSPWEKGEVP